MSKILQVLKLISVILFLIVSLTIYAYLPPQTSLFVENMVISKEIFFYSAVAIFVLVNFLFSMLKWVKSKKPENSTRRLYFWEWLLSLPVLVNFYMIFLIAYVGVLNNRESLGEGTYGYLPYMGLVLVIIWLIALLRIFLAKPTLDNK